MSSVQGIERLLKCVLRKEEYGTMSACVYDTAWVAMVQKTVDGEAQWLFPDSFAYILRTQHESGIWPAHVNDHLDDYGAILSTLAATYCLIQHRKQPYQLYHLHNDLEGRIDKAKTGLTKLLQTWRVESCTAVGFEVLVPSLLDLLAHETLNFTFPGRPTLLTLRDQKLSRISPEMLYKHSPSALLHSLEAFHGRADFDVQRVGHQRVNGSMMASPSASASYLIRSSVWDEETEAYLRLALESGEGLGSGAAPSAFPSNNFEMLWVISTLFESGVIDENLSAEWSDKMTDLIQDARAQCDGLVGFANGIEADLDDSAKASAILSQLGRDGFSRQLIEKFDSKRCLKTYAAERNGSVTANCNALLCILADREEYPAKAPTVSKLTRYVCDCWWEAGINVIDKWNESPYYATMLIAKALMDMLSWCETNDDRIDETKRVAPALLQCLLQTVNSQNGNGSWGSKGPREETAYAILSLTYLLEFPLATMFRQQMLSAIERGRDYLSHATDVKPEYIWVEKINYTSASISDAYILSAIHAPLPSHVLNGKTQEMCALHSKQFAVSATSINKDQPQWHVLGARALTNLLATSDPKLSSPQCTDAIFSQILASFNSDTLSSLEHITTQASLLEKAEEVVDEVHNVVPLEKASETAMTCENVNPIGGKGFQDQIQVSAEEIICPS